MLLPSLPMISSSAARHFLRAVASAVLVLCAGAVWAEKADNAQPMNIEADQLRHDEVQQTSVFTGKVVVTKGTIVLRGVRLEVRQDNDGNQTGVVTGSADKRAFFRQKRDTAPGEPEEFIEGEAATIQYNSKADSVRFTSNAELRRYRGGELSDQITGDVIVYNNATDVFTVDGKNTNKNAGETGSGRVRAVLAPRDKAAADVVPAPADRAPLQTSPRLGSSTR